MHKNRNQNALTRISAGLLKYNRTRNLFAVLAIILTTFMIATVFSLGISYADNFRTMMIRSDGTTASVYLPQGTPEQKHDLSKIKGVREIGEEISVGTYHVSPSEANKSDIPLMYKDKINFEKQYTPAISDIEGSYPEKADEIMVSEAALKTLGIKNPKRGMTLPLTFDTSGGQKTEEFRLSGWFKAYVPDSSSVILVSEKYCKENGYNYADGRLTITADKDLTGDDLSQCVSLTQDQEFVDRHLYSDNNMEDTVKIIALVSMLCLFIVFSGYLLIYNVFYISITKDIRIYGLLKTIGTSPKQLKHLVAQQGLLLGAIGIPCGLLLSLLTSFVIIPKILPVIMMESGSDSVSVSPLIYIFAFIFSAFTIWISCRKPAKLASNVSPVEAVKYTGLKSVKKKTRRSSSGGKIHKMAFRNIFRDKKRAFIVFLSLFMGSVTLLSVSGFFGSLSADNYADRYLPNDFSYSRNTQLYHEKQDPGYSEDFVKRVRSIDGIEKLDIISEAWMGIEFDADVLKPLLSSSYLGEEDKDDPSALENIASTMKQLEEDEEYGCRVYTVDKSFLERYNKEHEGKAGEEIDIDAFMRGETAIILKHMTAAEEMVGREITLQNYNSKKSCPVKIAVFMPISDFGCYPEFMMGGAPEGLIISSSVLDQLDGTSRIVNLRINCDEKDESRIKQELSNINKEYLEDGTYVFTARTDAISDFLQTMRTLQTTGSCISFLLLLIGVLNFINVMVTGIISRKNEFAVLESIGMTKGQIRKMISFEGLFYAATVGVLVLTLGNAILMIISQLVPSIADYAKFTYPAVQLILLLLLVFIICVSIPPVIYRVISKETVTERLHGFDN